MTTLAELVKRGPVAAALPALSGLLLALSWVGYGVWPLAFVALVPLVLALRRRGAWGGLWRGLLAGAVGVLLMSPWQLHAMRDFFHLSPLRAWLAYLLVSLAQGLVLGAAALLFTLARRWSDGPAWLLLPLSVCAAERFVPVLFQSYLGVALLPALPLMQIADLGGIVLVSALVALVNGALADSLCARVSRRPVPAAPLVIAALVIAAALAYGTARMASQQAREAAAPRRTIGIAQPAVGMAALHEHPELGLNAAQQLTRALAARGAELVLWPESAFNTGVVRLDGGPRTDVTAGIPVVLVTGAMRANDDMRLHNSAVLLSRDAVVTDAYDKVVLMAFGERNPLAGILPDLPGWSSIVHFEAGRGHAPLHDGPWRYATSICYEGTQPAHVRGLMQGEGEGRPHLLINLTNDSWFGAGFEQSQHLALQAVRAIEHRRWLARASTSGVSAFVDSSGRIVESVASGVRGTALRSVPMLEGSTLYQATGDWPGALSLLVLALRGAGRRSGARRGLVRSRGGAAGPTRAGM